MDSIKKAILFYKDEFESNQLYSYLSNHENNIEIKKLFGELSKIESSHAKFWYLFLKERNIRVKHKFYLNKLWIYKILRSLLGTKLFITLLEMKEISSTDAYYNFYKNPILKENEKIFLSKIIEDELEHEHIFAEKKKDNDFGNIRDFILGMNDGLVEILGTVTGLAAVYPTRPLTVGTSGLVVGVAGALSMAIGAFTSVRSQRQVNEGIKNKMEILFNVSKDKAKDELFNKLHKSGIPDNISSEVVEKLSDNKNAMTNLLIEDVKENELRSALYTGVAYLVGLIFPVIPFFFIKSSSLIALIFSAIFAAIALSVVGTVVSIASETLSLKNKVFEMVATGLGAAALSYLFGKLVQIVFGGKIGG